MKYDPTPKFACEDEAPEIQAVTGSVHVSVYSEDNQFDTLSLAPGRKIRVIGEIL